MKLKDELLNIIDCLDEAGIDYGLCGGLAVVVHGFPRLTRDIDVLIRPESLEDAKTQLARIGYDLDAGTFQFNQGAIHETVLHRVSRAVGSDLITLDVLLIAPALEKVWASRETLQLGARRLKVVSKEGLITMKLLSGSPQDLADIDALRRIDNR